MSTDTDLIFGAGIFNMMRGMKQDRLIEKDRQAELIRQEGLQRLRQEIAREYSHSGYVDKNTGRPILQREVEGYDSAAMVNQGDWDLQRAEEIARMQGNLQWDLGAKQREYEEGLIKEDRQYKAEMDDKDFRQRLLIAMVQASGKQNKPVDPYSKEYKQEIIDQLKMEYQADYLENFDDGTRWYKFGETPKEPLPYMEWAQTFRKPLYEVAYLKPQAYSQEYNTQEVLSNLPQELQKEVPSGLVPQAQAATQTDAAVQPEPIEVEKPKSAAVQEMTNLMADTEKPAAKEKPKREKAEYSLYEQGVLKSLSPMDRTTFEDLPRMMKKKFFKLGYEEQLKLLREHRKKMTKAK